MRRRGIPAKPATLGQAALYIADQLIPNPSDRAEGRRVWRRVKMALSRQFAPWRYDRPITPAMRGWIVERWGVSLPGEIRHAFFAAKPAKPCPKAAFALTHIPAIPPDELLAAFEACERHRQGLFRRIEQLKAENHRLENTINNRLAKAARDGAKRY